MGEIKKNKVFTINIGNDKNIKTYSPHLEYIANLEEI